LTASKSDGKLGKTQSWNFFEPRRSKRIKVENDVPFGYAIENIIYGTKLASQPLFSLRELSPPQKDLLFLSI